MRLGLSSIVLCTYVEKETTKQQTCVRLACTVWLHCHGNQQATNHAVPACGQTEGADRQRSGDWHLPCAAFLHLESTLKMEAMRRGMELNLDVGFVAFPAMSEEI